MTAFAKSYQATSPQVLSANALLYDSFEISPKGGFVYPEDFSGVYATGDLLTVYLTSDNEERFEFYRTLVGDYRDALSFQVVEYPLQQLEEVARKYGNFLLEKGCHVSVYYARVETNTSVIAVPSRYHETAIQLLADVPEDFLEVEIEEEATTTSTLKGGDHIFCIQNAIPMTLGAGGYVGTTQSIITCGHGVNAVGNTLKLNGSSSAFGSVSARVYPSANGTSVGDYSVITVNSSNSISGEVWKYGNYSSVRGIVGSYSLPPAGTSVIRYGYLTGIGTSTVGFNNGTVVYYDDNHNYYQISNMARSIVSSNGSKKGDSGGPYFMEIGGNLYFCGIQSGHNVQDDVVIHEYFTPYWLINTYGSFTVKTIVE